MIEFDTDRRPDLRCPDCGESLGEVSLGMWQEGPFFLLFHEGCGAVLGAAMI